MKLSQIQGLHLVDQAKSGGNAIINMTGFHRFCGNVKTVAEYYLDHAKSSNDKQYEQAKNVIDYCEHLKSVSDNIFYIYLLMSYLNELKSSLTDESCQQTDGLYDYIKALLLAEIKAYDASLFKAEQSDDHIIEAFLIKLENKVQTGEVA